MNPNPSQSTTAPEQGRRNLLILAASSFLRGAHNSIYMVIWQPFVLSLGVSMPTLGLLNSIGGINGLVTALVQPLGGWFADRLGHKLFLIIASLAALACYGFLALAGLWNVWALLLLGVIFYGTSLLSRPTISAMTAESVTVEQHGRAFSLITLSTMVPGIVAPVFGGWMAGRFGYVNVFPVMLLLEALALFLVWRYLKEMHRPSGGPIHWHEASLAMLRSIIPPKGLVGFFCAVAGDSFVWGMGWGMLYGMVSETFHFTAKQLGIMSGMMYFTWAVTQIPIGRYIDRHGTKAMLIFSEAIGIPLMLLWMTQTRFEIFVASQILFGMTASTWVPTVSTYLARRISETERAEVFGRLNAFRGLIAFPAPFIGGLLYAWGGLRAPLAANLIGILVVIAILIFFVHEPKKENSRDSG